MSRWRRSANAEPEPVPLEPAPALEADAARLPDATASLGSRWSRATPAASAAPAVETGPRTLNFQSFVELADGLRMPILGLGTRQLKGTECREAVKSALRFGYRLLDTAPGFSNEEEICNGIRAAGLKREDVFIVSKLPPSEHGDEIEDTLKSSLERLGTSYIDLYLIQSPKGGSIIWTWDAMLQLRKRGLAKAVGVCNFNVVHLQSLARTGRELPQVLQVELHVAHQQKDLCHFCRAHGIVLMSSSPLARMALPKRCPQLAELAQRMQRSVAELGLRWCLQQGFVTIPKTKTPARMESNAAFGFSLTEEDMKFLSTLDAKLVASPEGQSAMEMPWEELVAEVSEVSDGDVGDDAPRRRRRRKKRGKGKGKGPPSGKGKSKQQGAGGGSAQRAADMLFRIS